jgi:hypothetical protein
MCTGEIRCEGTDIGHYQEESLNSVYLNSIRLVLSHNHLHRKAFYKASESAPFTIKREYSVTKDKILNVPRSGDALVCMYPASTCQKF